MTDERQDDLTIPDSEDLYRRIAKQWLVPDNTFGGLRLSRAAFKDRKKEISVHLSSLITPLETMARGGTNIVGLVAVTAGQARSLNQVVVRDPNPNDEAHALICGSQPKSIIRQLTKIAKWICYPDDGMLPTSIDTVC